MGISGSICTSSSFPEVSPYHKSIHTETLKRQITNDLYTSSYDIKKLPDSLVESSIKSISTKSLSGTSDEKGSDEVGMQPAKRLEKGAYCTLPQIFHRRDLIHKNKLTTFERKIIMKNNIDVTVAEVLETEGTYLKLHMLSATGVWEVVDKIWTLHVEEITKEMFEAESKRLERVLQRLAKKIGSLRQKVREWHQECGHIHDDKINRVQDGVNVYYECTICGKILGIEKMSSIENGRKVFEILDSRWFLQSFPEHLRITLVCKDGDSQLIRKRELLFAERNNWIRKSDRELALFNSREYLTDALVILANMNFRS